MYNKNTSKKNASNKKAWAPRPEKPTKKSAPKSRQAKFVDQMKQTRKKLYYEKVKLPTMDSNLTLTENGAVAYKSSGSALVDINFKISAMREMEEGQIVALFRKAYAENPRLAMRWLFYVYDVREGQGERRLFKVITNDIASNGGGKMISNILSIIPEYGRWDMLYNFTKFPSCKKELVSILKKQLREDKINMKHNQPISLLAKWLKSANSGNAETRKLGLWTCHALGMSEKQYRKTLSSLRKYLDVVERKMSSNNWQSIDYEKGVASKANLLYNKAFLKHDETRRRAYLDGLTRGEAKINASVANPCEILNKYHRVSNWWIKPDAALEGMWRALPNLMEPNKSMLVVADGSGSMMSRCAGNISCLDVANSLAIYCADRAKGAFANKYITFSMTPQFVEFGKDWTLQQKIKEAERHDECANTNLEAVFDLILKTAIANHSPQSDLPENILILSDMAFDSMAVANNTRINGSGWYGSHPKVTKGFIEEIHDRFEAYGYTCPNLIFWNLMGAGRTTTFPITQDDRGMMVSGFSVNTLRMVCSGKTDPYSAVLDVISNKRYDLPEKLAFN